MQFTKQEYLDTYAITYFSRRHEQIHYDLLMAGKSLGGVHLAIGEEAVYCGVYSEVGPEDWYMPHHRARPTAALRYGVREFSAEVQAKSYGGQGGMSGGAHYWSKEKRIGPRIAILGQTQACGAGIAQYMKQMKTGGCVVMGCGDGDINLGAVSETLNIIAAWKLPVAIYIQNNGYAISTPTEYSSGIDSLAERASGFGLPSASYEGYDVFLVKEVMREAIARARRGEPSVNEFRTTRWEGHFVGDPDQYRDHDKIDAIKREKDPVVLARNFLLENGLATEEEIKAIEEKQEEILKDAFDYAISGDSLSREETRKHTMEIVYA